MEIWHGGKYPLNESPHALVRVSSLPFVFLPLKTVTLIPSMMTHFKKNRKKRDHVSAGHGRIGKHRKHPRGHGNASGMHHHWILFDKYHPGYFGKVEMQYFHKLWNKFHHPILNTDLLWSLIPDNVKEKVESEPSNQAPVIDLMQYGYFKLLDKGMLLEAKLVSKTMEKKVKEAGRAVMLTI